MLLTRIHDRELLNRYGATGDQSAFAVLVQRHLSLVYSAALRHLQDAQLCEDASQIVFALLARRAGDLDPDVIIPGWLVQTTRFVCLDLIRTRTSQMRVEREVAHLKPMIIEPSDNFAADQFAVRSQLDQALSKLSDIDRDAIVLRYFCNENAAQIGATLGLSEAAAAKRLVRAVHRLRGFLNRHAPRPLSEPMLAAVLARAVTPAPAGLLERASSWSAHALNRAADLAHAMPISSSKGVITVAAVTKTKVAATVAIIALAGLGGVTYHFVGGAAKPASVVLFKRGQTPIIDLHTPQNALRSVFAAVEAADSTSLLRCLHSANAADDALNKAWADGTIAAVRMNDSMQQRFGEAGLRVNGNGPLWPSAEPLPTDNVKFNVERTDKSDTVLVGSDVTGWGRFIQVGNEWKFDLSYPRDNSSEMTQILASCTERINYLRNDLDTGHCRTLSDAQGQRMRCGDGRILIHHANFEQRPSTQPTTGDVTLR